MSGRLCGGGHAEWLAEPGGGRRLAAGGARRPLGVDLGRPGTGRALRAALQTTAGAASLVVDLPSQPPAEEPVVLVVVRGRFARTTLRPRTRFDRLVLAVDASGELRGLARRSSAEIDDGIAALGSCVDVA